MNVPRRLRHQMLPALAMLTLAPHGVSAAGDPMPGVALNGVARAYPVRRLSLGVAGLRYHATQRGRLGGEPTPPAGMAQQPTPAPDRAGVTT